MGNGAVQLRGRGGRTGRPLLRVTLAALLVASFAVPLGRSGEIVTTRFVDRRGPIPEVLTHVPLKAVIAELLDPGDTGLGESLAAVLWRETLTAISDQAGAGVILARNADRENLVEILERDYHVAAVEIAREQQARMALWGSVNEHAGRLYVNTYLTLLTETGASDLRIQLVGESADSPGLFGGFEVVIPRTRFNFDVAAAPRAELLGRAVVLRAGAVVRQRPDKDAPALQRIDEETAFRSVGMSGGWFELRLGDGGAGHVWYGSVNLPPPRVDADGRRAGLRAGPGRDHALLATRELSGTLPVLDMRYREGHGLWYRVQLDDLAGWVEAFRVRARYSLPAVHFLAGLYRYYGKRYDDAAREFEQFIATPGGVPSHVNLAAAHQLLGACRVLGGGSGQQAFEPFSRAVELTPFDPSAYLLRSFAGLSVLRSPERSLADLQHALELDSRDPQARAFGGQLLSLTATPLPATRAMAADLGLLRVQGETQDLLQRFGIAAGTVALERSPVNDPG